MKYQRVIIDIHNNATKPEIMDEMYLIYIFK